MTTTKHWMPNDVARCRDKSCPLRNKCLRFLTRKQGGAWTDRNDYASTRKGDECGGFVAVKEDGE